MTMPDDGGDYVWPGQAIVPVIDPINGGWIWHDEMERSNVGNASQNPGWVSLATGTYAASAPAVTDVTERGAVGWVLTSSAVTPARGWRRNQVQASVAADGYVDRFETWYWCRWKMVTAKPDRAGGQDYYVSPFGAATENAGPIEPINGMGVVYDSDPLIDQWVLRTWRAGVASQLPLGLAWNTAAHISCALRHRGSLGIDVYAGNPRGGTPMGKIGNHNTAQIQPANAVQGYHAHMMQVDALLALNPQIRIDYWGWGSPGVQ